MKNISIVAALFFSFHIQAQVGIGTVSPDNSAVLDLSSNSKGLLIPRMNTVARTGIVAPATGLLVYDTDINQVLFYNGSIWMQAIMSPSGNNTSIQFKRNGAFTGSDSLRWTANGLEVSGATYANRLFVNGNSDVSQLIIRGNSTQSNTNPLFKLQKSDGTDLVTLHSDYYTNLFLGLASGSANSFSLSVSGYDNTAVGYATLNKNTTGYLNTVVGKRALTENLSGIANSAFGAGALQNNLSNYNVAAGYHSQFSGTNANSNVSVGTESMFSNSSGSGNTILGRQSQLGGNGYNGVVAVGHQSLIQNNGNYNTAVGSTSLYSNQAGVSNLAAGVNAGYSITGSFNTILGSFAGQNATGSQNVYLGFQAGYSATGDHKLYIANSATADPLIYGEFNNSLVKINGSLGIGVSPVTSAKLDVSSTTQGFLLPRMTAAQRTAIGSPAIGLHVYQTDGTEGVWVYKSTGWVFAY
jgi:hypothetical protein